MTGAIGRRRPKAPGLILNRKIWQFTGDSGGADVRRTRLTRFGCGWLSAADSRSGSVGAVQPDAQPWHRVHACRAAGIGAHRAAAIRSVDTRGPTAPGVRAVPAAAR